MMERCYDVFLSYRHKPLDAEVTQKVFNILESYRMPAGACSEGKPGISRVFRDTEELAVSRILSNTIEEALKNTKCLVVVCSEDTPSSEWVDREVATFIELGRAEKIFPLLISGDAESSFPQTLKKVPDIAERVMDVRSPGRDINGILKKAKTELLRVIAEVNGCSFPELLRSHKLARTRRITRIGAGAVALAAVVCTVCGMLWTKAEDYRQTAEKEKETSLAILEELTYGLPDSLVEIPGTYAKVAQILEENASQIERILEISGDSGTDRLEIAANEEKLATAMVTLGSYEKAEESQRSAVGMYAELAENGVEGAAEALASAKNNLGRLLTEAGEYEAADTAYKEAITLLRELNDMETLAAALGNSGANLIQLGDTDGATAYLEECLDIVGAQEGEPEGELLVTAASASCNLGTALIRAGDYAGAAEALEQSIAYYDRLMRENDSRLYRLAGLRAESAMASCLTQSGDFDRAEEYFDRAVPEAEALARDEENVEAQTLLGELYNNRGLCFNMSGDYGAAGVWYIKFAELEERLNEKTGTAYSQATLARACYNVAENAYKAGDYTVCRRYYDRCLELYAPVCEELGDYHTSEYLARLAYYQIIIGQDYAASLENAGRAVELQPNSVFACCIFGYSLMYNGRYDACDQVFSALAALGGSTAANVLLDFDALTAAGLYNEHMESVTALMDARQN